MVDEPGDLATLKAILANIPNVAERLGLLFTVRLQPPGYDATPRNCLTFAGTGGDGVHFGYLRMDGTPLDSSPIVMTVPSARHPNRVVGRTLRHFLSFGRYSGFFTLEQLQYDYARTVAALDARRLSPLEPDEARAMAAIAIALPGDEWRNHGATLAALEAEFAAILDVPPER
ncbi:hypothetical protein [Erythrobacter sp. JK5]|uniref:hypothetical protein n=1 Tax=Erythrobacter sp. JK5 TaxID=2829500 RepID=UPI001BA97912|nr:hypothetical protein [Erythrobacter sp. JK5]QUL39144.1 hypothetical protein KDC96_07410 [Erythrobacter sp. JK5]